MKLFFERNPAPFVPAMLATLPYPEKAERLHTLISASTGAGKSQTLLHLLNSIRERGERAVVFDNGGEFRRNFARPGDTVIDPFSDTGPGWRLANEARSSSDWERLAASFVGEGTGNSKEWHAMAKAMFAAIGSSLHRVYGRGITNAELQRVLVEAPGRELKALVAGTTAGVLATEDDRAEARLQSVRMSLIDALKSWRFIKDGDFSFRDWTSKPGNDWLFLPYSDFNLPLAKVLIAAWADILVSAALEGGTSQSDKTTWIIIDELDSLGEIGALLSGVTRLRKAGVAIVAAVQDHGQLRATYGHDRAATLLNNLSHKVILRTVDAEAAENLSKALGEQEFMERKQSYSDTYGGGGGTSTAYGQVTSRMVMASELQSLPDLNGYVKFAGDWPAVKVKIPYLKL